MKKFHPDLFAILTKTLQELLDNRKHCQQLGNYFDRWESLLSSRGVVVPVWKKPPEPSLVVALPLLVSFRDVCAEAGLNASVATIDKVAALQAGQGCTEETLFKLVEELMGRLHDEMKAEVFLHLESGNARFLEPQLFGEAVAKRFPAASIDIEEAGKCFAFGRHTASVFHLMRVMEHGLFALAAFLRVTYEHKSWDAVIKKMRSEVEDYKASSFKGDLDFLRQTLERFTGVQTALRNEVMHARSFYDEERAHDIYRSVRAFMGQLATKLTEMPKVE